VESAARLPPARGRLGPVHDLCGMRTASLVESSGSSGRSRAAQPDGEPGLGAEPWQRAQPRHASKQPAGQSDADLPCTDLTPSHTNPYGIIYTVG
jgi:hypothetical protein